MTGSAKPALWGTHSRGRTTQEIKSRHDAGIDLFLLFVFVPQYVSINADDYRDFRLRDQCFYFLTALSYFDLVFQYGFAHVLTHPRLVIRYVQITLVSISSSVNLFSVTTTMTSTAATTMTATMVSTVSSATTCVMTTATQSAVTAIAIMTAT